MCGRSAPEVQRNSTRQLAFTPCNAAFTAACVELFANFAVALSVPKSIGQIYGVLYASPGPLSFTDILERLDISKGSVSQGLGLLKTLGAVVEVAPADLAVHGARAEAVATDAARSAKTAYLPELSLRRLISAIIRERIQPLSFGRTQSLSDLAKLAEEPDPAREYYRGQAHRLIVWRKQLNTVLPILLALLGSREPRKKVRSR